MNTPEEKNSRAHFRVSDVRGVVKLASQAVSNVTHITEGVHQSVWKTMGMPGDRVTGRTSGITGLVYKSIQGVNRLVALGVDAAFDSLNPLLESAGADPPGTPRCEAVLAALNGVMGDRLAESHNPLATPMTLRHRGEPLNWPAVPDELRSKSKVLLLIHGLCRNDLQWKIQKDGGFVDHGEALASALNYAPIHLRYNSGRHTSQNGRELSAHLEQLVEQWPIPITELTVVAHSMGGLIIRGAVHYGRQEKLVWPDRLKKIVFLGTPHHGAPLERAGHWVDQLLPMTPYSAPFARLAQLRSAGITDLRHGHVLDEDWHGHDRFRRKPDTRRVVPLPEGVACYTVAATTTTKRGILADHLVGDGLVPLRSALGQHDDPRRCLGFEESARLIAFRMNHMELLSSPEVTRRMIKWLTP